jgi:hypothetical protein
VGGVFRRHVDGGRAVAGADDPDGHRVQLVKAEQQRQADGEKNAELPGRAEQEDLRVLQQGAEVRHGADADEDEQGEKLVGDPHIVDDPEEPLFLHQPRQRDVGQDGTEADRHQQQGFDVLLDPQDKKKAADRNHHRIGPVQVGDTRRDAPKPDHQRVEPGARSVTTR